MIDRRSFGKLVAAAGVAAIASPRLVSAASADAPGIVKPRVLRKGDTIGMPAPASNAFEPDRIRLAKEQVEALGFNVVLGEHVFEKHGYFAGTDEQRAADVNAMFADEAIDGIFFFTGGWGAPRILPHLDFDLIRRNPKVILGYSDITSLLYPIHQKTGLVTFHGPVAASNIRPWTRRQLERAVMSTDPIGVLSNPEKSPDELVERFFRIIPIRPGVATGRLTGGNLTLVSVLMGTPWEIDTDGKILFIEDIHEGLYRVDRMLTQLQLSGKLSTVAGVIFGFCTECPTGDGIGFSLEEILRDHLEPLGVPVMSGFAFGHIREMVTLPIGLEATMDAGAGTLTINESAVV
ncbi:MAG TPA: LD-carboxypeptidase [Thermoanaerobaculia bacterium]|nr:LD-carboxypeptidase [Thermoanaerobaculia bacterium]